MGEDFAEDVVGGDFACDFAEVVHTFADVLAYEVAAEAAVEAVDAVVKASNSATLALTKNSSRQN